MRDEQIKRTPFWLCNSRTEQVVGPRYAEDPKNFGVIKGFDRSFLTQDEAYAYMQGVRRGKEVAANASLDEAIEFLSSELKDTSLAPSLHVVLAALAKLR
ncbi:MAG: hypothetical protein KDH96_05730 [Candidatus Riesia sp.]|nr:hypothetical protein [Candidatus Riesia sp.]